MKKFLAEGILYYDDGKNLREKVERYVQKFIDKMKIKPTVCLVHESDFEEVETSVQIYPTINILPNHLLIGRKQNEYKLLSVETANNTFEVAKSR